MKTSLRVLTSTFLIAPLLLTGGVIALESQTPENTVGDKALLQERLEKRKTELNIKQITATEKTRIQQKCKASQGSLSSLKGRLTGIDTSRTNVYSALTDRFTKLVDRLKLAGADTSELEAELGTLSTKIETFKTDLETYKLAVSDLAGMDCTTDPVAFKASLEAARAARVKVKSDTTEIKNYLSDTIKPTLKTIRDQLATNKTDGGNE